MKVKIKIKNISFWKSESFRILSVHFTCFIAVSVIYSANLSKRVLWGNIRLSVSSVWMLSASTRIATMSTKSPIIKTSSKPKKIDSIITYKSIPWIKILLSKEISLSFSTAVNWVMICIIGIQSQRKLMWLYNSPIFNIV